MSGILTGMLRGAAAGAAGTTALNAVTCLDMAVRGRPISSAPEGTVTTLADKAGILIPGDEDTRKNRIAGLGPLAGLVTGIGVGALLGASRAAGWRPGLGVAAITAAAAAMLGSDAPMTALGISDPRTWAAKDWLADALPHLAYGLVTAAWLSASTGTSPKLPVSHRNNTTGQPGRCLPVLVRRPAGRAGTFTTEPTHWQVLVRRAVAWSVQVLAQRASANPYIPKAISPSASTPRSHGP